MLLILNTRPPEQNVRVTTDFDRAIADHVESVIARMQYTRCEFISALVHAYLQQQEQG